MIPPERILIYCDAPSHSGKKAAVERLHHVGDGHWVADAHRGKGRPEESRLAHYIGPTSRAFRSGHRKAVLVCPLCGDDLKRQMTAVEPVLNALARAGQSEISIAALRRYTAS